MQLAVMLISVVTALILNFIVLTVRTEIYKLNSKRRIVHAETHNKMVKIMLRYNELKSLGKFSRYDAIDKYLQQSVYYSEHFVSHAPNSKKVRYNSDSFLRLLVELASLNNKEIFELFFEFTRCLTYEYKYFHPIKYFFGVISEKLFILKLELKYKFRATSKKIDKDAMKKIDSNIIFEINNDTLVRN